MHAHEVVMCEVQRDRSPQILDLFAKGVREPGKPTHLHTHGQVLPFNVAGRNVLLIRIAVDRLANSGNDARRAIAPTGVRFRFVVLYNPPEIYVVTKRPPSSVYVGRQRIG